MTQPKKPEDKLPLGAPTKYQAKFCRKLVNHMASGLSFESFAGAVGVTNKTLYNWLDSHPDFLHAKERAWEASRLWWERLGIMGVQGFGPEIVKKRTEELVMVEGQPVMDAAGEPIKKVHTEYGAAQFNPTTWIFTMCNRFKDEWRQRNEVTGQDGAPLIPAPVDWKTLAPDAHVQKFVRERDKLLTAKRRGAPGREGARPGAPQL